MITRWDPFQEMLSLRNTVDRLFENSYRNMDETSRALNWGLPLDVIETDNDFQVKASLPGIKPEDMEITFSDNILTIKGNIREDVEEKNARYHLRERRYGTFTRSLSLGARVDGDKIVANYEDGVLTLALPKAEEIKPKRISINPAKVISAKSK